MKFRLCTDHTHGTLGYGLTPLHLGTPDIGSQCRPDARAHLPDSVTLESFDCPSFADGSVAHARTKSMNRPNGKILRLLISRTRRISA
jgi:hypothetical protein